MKGIRPFPVLGALAVATLVASGGWLARGLGPELDSPGAALAEARRELARFGREARPRGRPIEPARWRSSRAGEELSRGELALPRVGGPDREELAALAGYAKGCANARAARARRSPQLAKAWAWHEYRCGARRELPDGFFARAPYLHPSGFSYVFLAIDTGIEPFVRPEWLREHERYLHLLELPRVAGAMGPDQELLRELGAWQLDLLQAGEAVVLTRSSILVAERASEDDHAPGATYRAYDRGAWESFAAREPLALSERSDGPGCLARAGNACWIRNPRRDPARQARWVAIALLAVSAGALAHAARGARQRARLQREDAARRLFILQMLTHELRTPATSLKLSLEVLRREFDRLPEASQREFLRMSSELQRLEHVTEASRRYLSSGPDAGPIAVQAVEIESVNELVAGILEAYPSVALEPLAQDRPARLDRYWLELCVRNLVDNAHRHGSPPVQVRLGGAAGELRVEVRDGGAGPRAPSTRPGMGIGLALVRQVAQATGGALHASEGPTTYTLVMKEMA